MLLGFEIFFLDLNDNHFSVYCAHTHSKHKDMLLTLEAVSYCVITSFINLHTACMHTIDTKLYCKLLTLEAVNSVAVNSTITFGLCVFNLI